MEQGLLSCFFHAPDTLLPDAATTVLPSWFYGPDHRLIYEKLLERHTAGHPVQYIAFGQYMQDAGLMDKIGGWGRLSELTEFVPTPTHYGYFKGILRDKAMLREIIALGHDAVSLSYQHTEDVPALLGALTERFFSLSKLHQGEGKKTFKQVIEDYLEVFEKRTRGEIEVGTPSRWNAFNRTFGGITPTFWLIAGFPSDGKSTLVQNMAEDTIAHGKHVLWFSYEMGTMELCDRLVTSHTQLDSQEVFFPQNGVSRGALKKIGDSTREMGGWPLHLHSEATWTADQVVAETRALALKHTLGLVIVDYLQLVPTNKQFGTRAEEVAFISRTFKLASSALNLPFVVLSQLNDDGKTKESRAPNQDASNILFIEKESSVTSKGTTTKYPAGLRVVKNRNGKRGDLLPIRLCGPTFTFVEDLKP